MATGFTFIISQRGKEKLVFDGYIYKLDRVRGERSYWICHLPDCKGRVVKHQNEIRHFMCIICWSGQCCETQDRMETTPYIYNNNNSNDNVTIFRGLHIK